MRGCHDPAGGRGVRRGRIEVLLSERNLEPGRTNRLRTLTRGRLPKLVAIRGGARQYPGEGGRALAVSPSPPQENLPAKPPVEPLPEEACVDLLYLFGCALFWRKRRFKSAGWEFIRCLGSSVQAA